MRGPTVNITHSVISILFLINKFLITGSYSSRIYSYMHYRVRIVRLPSCYQCYDNASSKVYANFNITLFLLDLTACKFLLYL